MDESSCRFDPGSGYYLRLDHPCKSLICGDVCFSVIGKKCRRPEAIAVGLGGRASPPRRTMRKPRKYVLFKSKVLPLRTLISGVRRRI